MNNFRRSRPALVGPSFAIMIILGFAATPSFAGSYQFTTINVPGAPSGDYLNANTINDSGQVLLSAQNSSSGLTDNIEVYSSNTQTYTIIPGYPGSAPNSTYVDSMNNSGVIVGGYSLNGSTSQSFTYSGGVFTTLNTFGGSGGYANGISNNGNVVGIEFVNGGDQGYLLSGGQYTALQKPGATLVDPEDVNNSGKIVGWYSLPGGPSHSNWFLLQNGNYSPIVVPGWQNMFLSAINDAGVIVGEVSNQLSFDTGSGFVDTNGVFTMINVPGSAATEVFGINNEGQIAGTYLDANGNWDAFVGSPIPEPTSYALLVAGVISISVSRKNANKV